MLVKNHAGLTLIEIILVIVIVSSLGALAIPQMRSGLENRQAKQALETARSLAHAVRMYNANHGDLPPTSAAGLEWVTLENEGYIKRNEMASYGGRFTYSVVPNDADPEKWAVLVTVGPRTLRVENSEDKFSVSDTAGYYNK